MISDESGDGACPRTPGANQCCTGSRAISFLQAQCSALTDTKMNKKSYCGKRKGNAQIILEQCDKSCSEYVGSVDFVINADLGEWKSTFQKEYLCCV